MKALNHTLTKLHTVFKIMYCYICGFALLSVDCPALQTVLCRFHWEHSIEAPAAAQVSRRVLSLPLLGAATTDSVAIFFFFVPKILQFLGLVRSHQFAHIHNVFYCLSAMCSTYTRSDHRVFWCRKLWRQHNFWGDFQANLWVFGGKNKRRFCRNQIFEHLKIPKRRLKGVWDSNVNTTQ